MTSAPAFIRPRAPDEDQLAEIRATIAEVRDLEAMKYDLEDRLKSLDEELQFAYFTALPDLFAAAGVTAISLPADGNSPAVEAKAQGFQLLPRQHRCLLARGQTRRGLSVSGGTRRWGSGQD